ncbi:DUF6515 family protein [Desulforhopalus sp. 52FAK]
MVTVQHKKYSRFIVIAVSSFVLSITCLVSPVMATPGYPGGRGPGPRLGFGPGPGLYTMVSVGAMAYFFMDGLFYRQGPKGYIVAPAPVGAVITALPPAAYMVTIDGQPFYSCSGIFYKQVPQGYIVVSQPVKHISPEVAIGQELLVTAQLLNIRLGPGLNYSTVGQLKKHDIIRVEAVSEGWVLIRLSDDTTGWIKTEYTAAIDSDVKG